MYALAAGTYREIYVLYITGDFGRGLRGSPRLQNSIGPPALPRLKRSRIFSAAE